MYCEISKVKTALASFKALKGIANSNNQSRTDGAVFPDVQANFKYIRFLPKDEDELIQLDEAGLDLTDEPMHFEIEIPGDYYQDPSVSDSAITWMYAVVPIDYQLPSNIQTEIISNVYLFNTEPEELEPDESEDGYADDYGSANCYANTPYISNGKIMPCAYSRRSQLMQQAYDWLTQQGVNADEFELYLMNQAGYHGDDYDDAPLGTNGRHRKYYPEGNIRVEDNDVNNLFPVKGVMVKSRNFLKIKRGYTDANGHFRLDRGYRKKAQIIIKWKNRGAVTRGIDSWFKVWDLIFPIKHKLGWFYRTDLENIRQDYLYNANERTQAAERWTASHYLNSIWEVYEQSQALGTPWPPDKMRVYLVARWFNGAAFTPMFSQVYGREFPIEEFNQLLQLKLGRAIKGALKKLLLKNAPDIFIPTFQTINDVRSTENSSDLINTCYHETGHAIHFAAVGDDYWKTNTYPAYGYNLVAYGGDYGPKTGPFAPFVAVTEMWGFYYGNTMTARKYNGIGTPLASTIRDVNIAQLENNIPDDNINVQYFVDRSRSWIPLGMPHDMTDVGELALTGVTDNANAYNMQRVFTGMAAGATDVCGYTALTLNATNNLQATEVTQLLTDYRWNICCINCRPSNSK